MMVSLAIYTTYRCALSLLVIVDADTGLVSAAANCTTLGVATCGLVVPEILAPETPHSPRSRCSLLAPVRCTSTCLVGDPSLVVQRVTFSTPSTAKMWHRDISIG